MSYSYDEEGETEKELLDVMDELLKFCYENKKAAHKCRNYTIAKTSEMLRKYRPLKIEDL